MKRVGDKVEIRFKLETFEHYEYDGRETRALIIEETEDEDYIRNIVPVIQEVIRQHSIGLTNS
ncbi:hypothetical protein C2I18_18315 [Paenibacillus sp. PK3_47]|uniref:hypothetical protein n=1 Tax=Paenibacillus sp. PK3_47 TaxID=2072642 RepID=UPI00201E7153|nr:hypothetical protein [Paenibacillus sp. PK3_47]UQZ35304.1 hypothetical protein C2I18_18315 [Paenibacillus sp. PK3_47]